MFDNYDELYDNVYDLLSCRNYIELKKLIEDLKPVDLAAVFNRLPEHYIPMIFRLLPKDLAADTFIELDSDLQKHLIEAFSDRELKNIVDELFIDDAVDLIEEMPANVVKRILAQADIASRNQINELLQYPADSAGAIMTTEYVQLKKTMTVEDAFRAIRKGGINKETVYTCYVTDQSRRLIGIVSVRNLLFNDYSALIGDIMETNIISVNTLTDQEKVARKFAKYDFTAMPVVDQEGRLVGIITIDDAIDVLQEETTEDIEKMAALLPSDKPYLKTGVLRIWANRIPWLLVLMISATFTGMIIENNAKVLNIAVIGIILTACIPMLMDTGGNAGSQASATIIRSIALGEITFKDTLKVIWKELRVSVLLGITLAVACFAKLMIVNRLYMIENGFAVSGVVCLSLAITVILAKFIGCIFPLIAVKVKLDPAVVASPFITTIVDALSLIIYCRIAVGLLG